jgi:predicted nucleic acid-binding protein
VITHLLDTSVYSQALKRLPVQTAVDRWTALGDDSCAVSIICEAEILFGIELKQSDALFRSYEQILQGRLHVIPVDDAVAKAYAAIKAHARRKGLPAAELDLLIAATARAHRLTLATLNHRHFEGIQGISVEDWSKSF